MVATRRLSSLEPRWIQDGERRVIGLTFMCPLHDFCYVGVIFENPFEGEGPPRGYEHKPCWRRTGDTFDTLTLTPSIRSYCRSVTHPDGPAEWHGYITNGDIITLP